MGRHAIGSTADELRAVRDEMYKMLKTGGPPPSGRWADLALLEPARELKARHASILLTFDAIVEAFAKAQMASTGAECGAATPDR
jgi:NifU-like protein involved in Fe-S cluster formation